MLIRGVVSSPVRGVVGSGFGGGGFAPEAEALFARFSTPAPPSRKVAINNLILALKIAGVWDQLDTFYCLAAADAQAAQRNWIANAFNLTPVNSPTLTVDQGYRGNGSNSSLATGYNFASSGGMFAQNSASLGVFVLDGGASAGADIGGLTGGSFNFIRPYSTGGNVSAYLNTTGTTAYAVKNALGLTTAVREGASQSRVYRDGTLIGSPTNNSAALPSANMQILTGDGTFSNKLVAFAFSGASLTAGQVAAVNAACRAYLAAIGTAVVDPIAPLGVWRGAWNTGGNAIAGSVAFAPADVVSHSGEYYYCIAGYTTSGASADPDADSSHWEPLPIFDQTTLFDDPFETGAGAFNGRVVDGLTWYSTGAGYTNAVVVAGSDGYATSTENTYFVMPGMTAPVTELGCESWDLTAPLFTLAIGGNGADTIFSEMIHVNFSGSGVVPLYWHSGASGQVFSSPVYVATTAWAAAADTRYRLQVLIRGRFLFSLVDGAVVHTLCHQMIDTIGSVAEEIYVQNHTGPSLGEQRHFQAWAKAPA